MNRALQLLLGGLLLCGSPVYAQDIELPASNLTVEAYVPLAEINGSGGPRALRAVDPLAVYSNVTNFTGSAFANGGASAGITRLVMDNLTFTTYPGVGNVTTLRFSVANLNGTPQSVRARIRFWNADGPSLGAGLGNGPGTYYAPGGTSIGYTFNAFTFQPGVVVLTGNLPRQDFRFPQVPRPRSGPVSLSTMSIRRPAPPIPNSTILAPACSVRWTSDPALTSCFRPRRQAASSPRRTRRVQASISWARQSPTTAGNLL